MEHFKDDFIFKIRSAIKEAYQRRDELNEIISSLDFERISTVLSSRKTGGLTESITTCLWMRPWRLIRPV